MSTILTDISPDLDSLHLRLLANARCADSESAMCGFVFDSLILNGADRLSDATIEETDLSIPLPYETLTDKELTLEIYYAIHLPKLHGRLGYDRTRVLLEGWIPVPAPRDDSGWLNIDYHNELSEPVGDYFQFNIEFTAPSHYTIVAPNTRSISADSATETAAITLDHAGHAAVALLRGFDSRDTTADVAGKQVQLRTYFRPDDAFSVDSVHSWTAFALDYLSHVVGTPYPHDQYITILGGLPLSGGLEQPQMTWISDARENQAVAGLKIVVVHEAVHQWFYYLIPSNQAEHPWMDESITDFFTAKALASTSTEQNGDMIDVLGFRAGLHDIHRVLSRTAFPRYSVVLPSDQYPQDDYFGAVYAKGGMVIATLDNLMAERATDFWRQYYRSYYLRRPSDSDFCRLAENYVAGDRPGRVASLVNAMTMPDYSVLSVKSNREQTTGENATIDSVQSGATVELLIESPIPFPIDVRIAYEDGSEFDTTIAPPSGKFGLIRPCNSPIAQVVIDPQHKITIDANYTNNSWSRTRTNGSDYRIFSVLTFLIESAHSIVWGW